MVYVKVIHQTKNVTNKQIYDAIEDVKKFNNTKIPSQYILQQDKTVLAVECIPNTFSPEETLEQQYEKTTCSIRRYSEKLDLQTDLWNITIYW